MMTPRSHE